MTFFLVLVVLTPAIILLFISRRLCGKKESSPTRMIETYKKISLASPSSCFSSWKYDVFLSFSGTDTRDSFTSHLYETLRQKGIITYKDDRDLQKGKPIQELLEAIQDSRFTIIIFSKNYASSAWCLAELAQANECRKVGRQTIIPIFYHMDPSVVSDQTEEFGIAFTKHEKSNEFGDMVEKLKQAMTDVAGLAGEVVRPGDNEADFIKKFVKDISRRFNGICCSKSSEGLFGIDKNVMEIISYLNTRLQDVVMVGICGLGGIGKTTIANVVYEKMSCQFEGSCFLANVREVDQKNGVVILQEQLLGQILLENDMRVWNSHNGKYQMRKRLGHKRILVVLDDVDKETQLEALVGLPCWFGSGSRIIVTTRDQHLLKKLDKTFLIEGLDQDDARNLFYSKAFKDDSPPEDYVQLSQRAVKCASGLPLALCILGASLFGKSVTEWRSALDKLSEIPDKKILDKLRISFDGLDDTEKKIFLDIACFFKGKEEDYVMQVLTCCGCYPEIGLSVLKDKLLVTVSNNKVWMHDLLQEMGRELVRGESREQPGEWSRLWDYEDVYRVFFNDTGTQQVEAIVLDSYKQEDTHLSAKAFSKMKGLRLLILENLSLSEDIENLSNNLRFLVWHRCPFKSLPSTFQPTKLVELHMHHSSLEQLWWQSIKPFESLKVIDLRFSKNLIKTPNFQMVPNLEILNLEGCIKLIEIHHSIGLLKNLTVLNLKDCNKIMHLPISSICKLKSLRNLILPDYIQIEIASTQVESLSNELRYLVWYRFPHTSLPFSFQPKNLVELHLRGSNIERLWREKQWSLTSLKILDLSFSRNLIKTPSFEEWRNLEKLNLEGCEALSEVHQSIEYLSNLNELNLSATSIVSLPESLSRLSRLENVFFTKCKKLQSLPNLPSCIKYLSMDGCTSLEAFPNPFEQCVSKSLTLSFVDCFNLEDKLQGAGAFAWLKCYLDFLLKDNLQGLFDSSCRFSMCFPGRTIPMWFSHKGIGRSVEVPLPADWCNDEWMGFSTCAIFQVCGDPMETSNLFCQIDAFVTTNQNPLILGSSGAHFSKVFAMSDQIWINFIPRENLKSPNELNMLSHLRVLFYCYGLGVKSCGVRLVYKQDIELLKDIRCS